MYPGDYPGATTYPGVSGVSVDVAPRRRRAIFRVARLVMAYPIVAPILSWLASAWA